MLAAVVPVALAAGAPAAQAAAERPNVVVIMSDDQTLDSMRYMPRTRELIGGRGATFPVTVTNWPLCCPSRATFLTGQYAHNHNVLGNSRPWGGFRNLYSPETLPAWLKRAGYYTAHIGKYLNGYESSPIGKPRGWSEWHGSKRTYLFYGYELFEDGQRVPYGSPAENPDAPTQPEMYSTDVFTAKAVELIGRRARRKRPFFLSVAYLAPHSGGPHQTPTGPSRCETTAKPAARHFGAFANEPLPQPPSFNEADVSDKPAEISGRPPLTEAEIERATINYRCRAESLLALDEGVEAIVGALRESGELNDTIIVYTSDNGFFHGEHLIASGKNRVYEESLRVPLMLRGPGIRKGIAVDEIAVNADLAPTILDAAGVTSGIVMDGMSLLPSLRHAERLRGREILVEQLTGNASGEGEEVPIGIIYTAIRNARYTYVENATGEIELYDLEADPFQLQSLHLDPAYDAVEAALASRLAELRECTGPSCRARPALRLRLPRPAQGRACRDPEDFLVGVRGEDTTDLIGLRFFAGEDPAGKLAAEPWERRIRARRLRAQDGRFEIRAVAELIDGRVTSVQRWTKICR